jgi:tRNA(fMet)-specific endonuclease VapC
MNKSLLDTDILSEVGKAINQTVTRNATAYRQAHGFLTLSVVSVMEVIQGYQRVGATARLQAFRNAIVSEEVLVFDQPAADLAGQIAGDLDRVGRPIGRVRSDGCGGRYHPRPGAGDGQRHPLPAYPAARLSPDPRQLANLTPCPNQATFKRGCRPLPPPVQAPSSQLD